jgi:hypothetical protein
MTAPVTAWGPNTHVYITEYTLKSPDFDSQMKSVITENYEYFLAGVHTPDITVAEYFTEGGKKYEMTHNMQFCSEIIRLAYGDDRYVALGYGCYFHEIADAVSHNYWIPRRIATAGIHNNVIHPVSEGVVEAHIIDTNPGIFQRTETSLDIVERDPKIAEIVYEAIKSSSPDSTVTKEAVKSYYRALKTALGDPQTIYGQLFRVRGGYEGISKVVAGTTSIRGAQPYLQQSIDDTVMIFQAENWNMRWSQPYVEPSGFPAIRTANSRIIASMSIILAAGIALDVILILYRKKTKLIWLLIVPLTLVLVLYILLLFVGVGFG